MELLLVLIKLPSINIKLSPTLLVPLFLLWVLAVMLLWERRKIRRVIERLVSLASQAAIPTYRSSLPQISNELARARRTQRALSMVVLSFEPESILNRNGNSGLDKKGNGAFRIEQMPSMALVFPQIGYILRNTARESDIVACGPAPNEFVVGLAETNKVQAKRFVERFNGLTANTGLMELKAGIAEFPADGLTLEDLMNRARSACEYLPKEEAALAADKVADHSPIMTRTEAV